MPKQDEAIYTAFEQRMGRDLARFFHHAEGAGLDTSALEGAVTLRIEGGRLAAIEYPVKKGAKAHVTAFSAPPDWKPDDLPLIDTDGGLVVGGEGDDPGS